MKKEDELTNLEKKITENHDTLLSAQGDLEKLKNLLPLEQEEKKESKYKQNSEISKGLGIVSQIISGMLVGIALGYGVDTLFGTSPWGMVILIPVGFIAGFVNMVRYLNEEEKKTDKGLDKNSKND